MKNLSPIAKFLVALSDEAGRIMLRHYKPLGMTAQKKADLSPVTEADLEINRMVIDRVKAEYPDYEILAEEISTDTKKSDKLFVCDPIDGTQMFAIGATMFAFSAAVVHDGEPIAGVLSNPLAKRTLIAEKGRGAFLAETGETVHVSPKDDLDKAFINAGWKDGRANNLLHEQGARCPEVYSICESSSLVALGGFHGDIYTSHHPHDIAAAKIVVEEAGGKVTDAFGHEQRYDGEIRGAIISNGKLHDRLVEIAKKSGVIDHLPPDRG
jgi:fructose-1,6-bisphosphatase/inositol monophosphatase family enzyme